MLLLQTVRGYDFFFVLDHTGPFFESNFSQGKVGDLNRFTSHHHIRDSWLMSSGGGGDETRQKGGIIGAKIPSEKRQIIHLLKISMGPPRRNIQNEVLKGKAVIETANAHVHRGLPTKILVQISKAASLPQKIPSILDTVMEVP